MILLACKTINGQPALVPTDEESEIALKKSIGKTLAVECKRARSPEQHRLYFAVLKLVFENQEDFKSIDDLRKTTLIDIGYSILREGFDGVRWREAESIAFHNLGHEKFQDVFNKSIDSWCEHFNHDREVLLNEVPIGGIR